MDTVSSSTTGGGCVTTGWGAGVAEGTDEPEEPDEESEEPDEDPEDLQFTLLGQSQILLF